ncbi:hypothetical protein, partial [Arthrobacter sp. TMS2-4]
QPPHTKCAATSQFNQSKNNRYQQTWHTIEFSNNRNNRLLTKPGTISATRLRFPSPLCSQPISLSFPLSNPPAVVYTTNKKKYDKETTHHKYNA